MRPTFLIAAPPWNAVSAGVQSLHLLVHALKAIGEDAHVVPMDSRPRSAPGPVIAVYPEILAGNPCRGDVVCRWLLCRPGKAAPDVSSTWQETDLLFHWRDYTKPARPAQRLDFNVIDDAIFNREGEGARCGQLIYSKKARAAGVPVISTGFDIIAEAQRRGRPFSPQEMGGIYRDAEVLICYEMTIAALEALHCGCAVYFQLSEYFPEAPLDWTPYGVAADLGSLGAARAEMDQARAHWEADNAQDGDRLVAFVDRCYAALGA